MLTESEALAKDAAEFAKMRGTTQADAEKALREAHELGPVTAAIREVIGDREVSITKEHLPVVRLRVEVSGQSKTGALDELVSSAPHPVEVVYVDKPSLEDLDGIIRSALPKWRRIYPQVTRAGLDDADTSNLMVFVTAGADVPSEDDLRKAAPEVPATEQLSIRPEPAEQPQKASRGGLRLNRQSNGSPECTSAFMATKDSTGTKVLLTAGHCANALAYPGWSSGATDTDMNFQNQVDNAQADAQSHLTQGIGSGLFWDGGAYRTVTSVTLRTQLSNGDFICKFGRADGFQCGQVLSIYSTFQGANVCNFGPCDNVWVAASLNIDYGDSGGPSFYGGSAIGINAGFTPDYGVVSSILYARSRLDVHLMGE